LARGLPACCAGLLASHGYASPAIAESDFVGGQPVSPGPRDAEVLALRNEIARLEQALTDLDAQHQEEMAQLLRQRPLYAVTMTSCAEGRGLLMKCRCAAMSSRTEH
jgi:hypothetical protein